METTSLAPACPSPCRAAEPVKVSGYGKIAVVPHENARLTRVGFGTPMGELMRRFWHPVCLSSELKDLPRALRILGEDLVAFRDHSGRVGVLDMHCAHRGASLEFGRIEKEGIRCCYHGWHFGRDGRCIDMPAEPRSSAYRERVSQPAYPVHEYGGLVFIYMGPPEKQPAFPIYDCLERPDRELVAYRNISRGEVADCNWLQLQENTMDPIHLLFLHTTISTTQFTADYALMPDLKFEDTEHGMKYIRMSTLANGMQFRRVSQVFMPNVRSIPEAVISREPLVEQAPMVGWWVPVDDTHTIGFHLDALRVVDGKPVPSTFFGAPMGRTAAGNSPRTCYEDTQREPDDKEAQLSQRPIAVHALEHLATTDVGVVKWRRKLEQALRELESGSDPRARAASGGTEVIHVEAGNEIRSEEARK